MKTLLYILSFLFSLGMFAQNNALFEQGNALYNDGKYAEAIEKYKVILETKNHSSDLYFNLANAHYKLNNIAPSIFYYEKALLLAPNDKEIANNLAFAKNMTIDAIDVVPEVGFSRFFKGLTHSMSFDAWAKISVGLVFLFVLLFLMYYFAYSTGRKRLAFIGSTLVFILLCITLAFAFQKYALDKKNKPAIVFAKESRVKSEPNLRGEESFRLHEGAKIQVIDSVNAWKKIKLSDGKTGWIPNEDIKELVEF